MMAKTVNIGAFDYELKYGTYSARESYNFVAGNIGANINEIDKVITIHAYSLDDYTRRIDVVEEAIWFELFCAFVYERYQIKLWENGDVDGDAYAILREMASYMYKILDAYYDVKTDLHHYISVERSKDRK